MKRYPIKKTNQSYEGGIFYPHDGIEKTIARRRTKTKLKHTFKRIINDEYESE